MPTREEEIDIMAFMLCPSDVMCPGCSRETVCTYRNCAQKLYDAGYRNIDGENYVSREWHDEQVLHAESEIERLVDENDKIHKNYVAILKHNAYLRNVLRDTKTEAVKEFAEKIKLKMPKLDESEPGEYFLASDIDNLLKEYFEDGEQPT